MDHATIYATLRSLIESAGDVQSGIGYGFGRVLETLTQIADENQTAPIVVDCVAALRNALHLAEGSNSPFQIIDVTDTRTDAQLATELVAKGFATPAVFHAWCDNAPPLCARPYHSADCVCNVSGEIKA